MPGLTIQGTKFNRILNAEVKITHGDAREAIQIPECNFIIDLPLDEKTFLDDWVLAPHGPARWKTVELITYDRSKTKAHTWTMHKAYCHSLEEVEFPEGSGGTTDQGNFVRIVVRGVLPHTGIDYDGKNILTVAAGQAEAGPS